MELKLKDLLFDYEAYKGLKDELEERTSILTKDDWHKIYEQMRYAKIYNHFKIKVKYNELFEIMENKYNFNEFYSQYLINLYNVSIDEVEEVHKQFKKKVNSVANFLCSKILERYGTIIEERTLYLILINKYLIASFEGFVFEKYVRDYIETNSNYTTSYDMELDDNYAIDFIITNPTNGKQIGIQCKNLSFNTIDYGKRIDYILKMKKYVEITNNRAYFLFYTFENSMCLLGYDIETMKTFFDIETYNKEHLLYNFNRKVFKPNLIDELDTLLE